LFDGECVVRSCGWYDRCCHLSDIR
jgi:hypothetical protein